MAGEHWEAVPPSRGWQERSARAGWNVRYTMVGARRRSGDIAEMVSDEHRANVERLLAQVFVAATPAREQAPDNVRIWATTARRLLQRGERPPISPALEHTIDELMPRPRRDVTPDEAFDAAVGACPPVALDPSFELHPRWESPFWSNAVREFPDLTRWITPQASLESLAKLDGEAGEHWVDFLFAPPWRNYPVVIELDGSGHERRPGIDRSRDALLSSAGVQVARTPGSEGADPSSELFDRLRNQRRPPSTPDPELQAWIHAPTAVHRFCFALVEAVEAGHLPLGEAWHIAVADLTGLAHRAAGWLLSFLGAIDALTSARVLPDEVTVNGQIWARDTDGFVQRSTTAIEPQLCIALEPFTAPHNALPSINVPTVVVRSAFVPGTLAWDRDTSTTRSTIPDHPDPHTDAALRRLVRDVFGHSDFRDGQLEALQQTLRGGDCVVLLPTGSGKSLIYQLAGLLRPGLCLVIDPIRALIDDQERRLREEGISRVAALHSGRATTRAQRDALQASVASGDALFAFVTPERLQNTEFRDYLRDAAARVLVNLAVVDEAHCVSEWGHDFRTSYLKLGRNLRRFCSDDHDVWPPLLALTGTASPAVPSDTLRELEIDGSRPGAMQRPENFDRPNLRYRISLGTQQDLPKRLRDALATEIGELLGFSSAPPLNTTPGIAFVANVRGAHGLLTTREMFERALTDLTPTPRIGIYGGRTPRRDYPRQQWEREKQETALAFLQGRLPLLIATKGIWDGDRQARYPLHNPYRLSVIDRSVRPRVGTRRT